MAAQSPEQLFIDNLDLVAQIVRIVARKRRLSADAADELQARVHLKLVDRDYDVLRQFRSSCSLRTYLVTVVTTCYLDQLVEELGKWRPSVEAKRLGTTAILLERLLNHDEWTLDQACEILRTNYRVSESREDLRALAARLPPRTTRRFVADDALDERPDPHSTEEAVMRRVDVLPARARLLEALDAVVGGLSTEDRLLVKLRFYDGLALTQIAQLLRVADKALYRRWDQLKRTVRQELEARGIDRTQVQAIVDAADIDRADSNGEC